MIKDIFIPSKIGSYYIFQKRVLGFEITTNSVQASLLHFSRSNVELENSMTITLQDNNETSIVNAIKKIATNIGSYDEVVTSLTSSAVIFKELVLPFVGREKIQMIVNYEVEPLLPFSLDDAVIDFMITDENKDISQTTILVAATRRSDLDSYMSNFEKAGVQISTITLDMFALYDFYRHTMYVAQAHTSLLLVDFGVDAIRVLYIQKGILKSVRLVPYGLATMTKRVDHSSLGIVPEEYVNTDMTSEDEEQVNDKKIGIEHQVAQQIIADFCKQISLSISFFQKQIKGFIPPARVVCLGAGTDTQDFVDQASVYCQLPVEILDLKRIAHRNRIQAHKRVKINAQQSASLIITLSAVNYGDINFLSLQQQEHDAHLLQKQLLIVFFVSIATLIGIHFHSNHQIKLWSNRYEASRKEMAAMLKDQMDIDVKKVKRVSEIVTTAQSKLEQAKKVCFSFSQSNNVFLRHLEELGRGIDRVSVGLDLKKLSMNDKEVVLQGKVKGFAELETFEEELMGLNSFILKDRLPDVAFTATLQIKESSDTN